MRQKQEVRTLHASCALHTNSTAIDNNSKLFYRIELYRVRRELYRNEHWLYGSRSADHRIRRHTRGREAGRTRGKARTGRRRSSTSATRGRDRVTWMVELRGREFDVRRTCSDKRNEVLQTYSRVKFGM